MAISIACSSCHKALKVKDELAGRKVKCPQCGNVIAVQQERAEANARITAKRPVPSRAARDEDDEPEEDERPRKKKKKKKAKSNQGLIIGAAIGGVALVAAVLLIILLGRNSAAKDDKVAQNQKPAPVNPQPVEPPPGNDGQRERKPQVTGVGRVREGVQVRAMLHSLGLAYQKFETETNRGPRNQKELSPYYENNTETNEALSKGWITFIWGTPRRSLIENLSMTIIAYETDPDVQGIRLVLFGDGSVDGMNEAEFAKAPKAKGR
jgi:hypothetical protein